MIFYGDGNFVLILSRNNIILKATLNERMAFNIVYCLYI